MLSTFQYKANFDNPQTLNHSNIISIFAYMLNRTEIDFDESFSFVVNKDFLPIVCTKYDTTKDFTDTYGIPRLIADWGEYKAIFTSNLAGDGLDLELYYCEGRIKPSANLIHNEMNHLDDKYPNCCGKDDKRPIRNVFYVSPWEPNHWYDKYRYMVDNHKKSFSLNDGTMGYMIEFLSDDDENNESQEPGVNSPLPSDTPMEKIWIEHLPNKMLVEEIGIYYKN